MLTYDRTTFKATHNSYSAEKRGSLSQQLNTGVRCLDLDVHDNDGAKEWTHGRTGNCKDKKGDDDVAIFLPATGSVSVQYRTPGLAFCG